MMRMQLVAFCTILGFLAGVGSTTADEAGPGTAPTGGLLFTARDADFAVDYVELYVSVAQVRVTYRVRNAGTSDIPMLVAFPMPDVTGRLFGVANPEAVVPETFRITRNGEPAPGTLHQYVTALGVDRTAVVQQLGLPLNPALAKLVDEKMAPIAAIGRLQLLGMAEGWFFELVEGVDPGLPSYSAVWTLHSSYDFEDSLQPGETVTYVLSYAPAASLSTRTSYDDAAANLAYEVSDYATNYCMDRSQLDEMQRVYSTVAIGETPVRWRDETAITLDFTGWGYLLGLIKDFRLTVDRGAPDNFAATCWDHPFLDLSGTAKQSRLHDAYLPIEPLWFLFASPTRQ